MSRRGMTLALSVVALTALTLVAGLVVDWANVQLTKGQMQAAVDASARAGAAGLKNGQFRHYAQSTASKNQVRGENFSLKQSEVQLCMWQWGGASRQAVEVAAGRQVPLSFGKLLGQPSATVRVKATALMTHASLPPFGVVAMEGINMRGVDRIDSYSGDYRNYNRGNAQANATVATRGQYYNFDGNVVIKGDLAYVNIAPCSRSTITGKISQISAADLDYRVTPTPARFDGTFGNENLTGHQTLGGRTLASGDYLIDGSLSMNGNSTIQLSVSNDRPVRLFIKGDFTVAGSARIISTNLEPGHLEIHMLGGGGVNINGHNQLVGAIYAPSSPLNMNGGPDIYGSVVVKQLSMSGNAGIHVDESMISSRKGRIVLVD